MFKQIAAAAALVIASSSAIAAEAPKFYVGADVSSTEIDGSDRETGFGGFVGYKFNENIAVEAGYHRLAETDMVFYDSSTGIEGDGSVKVNQTAVSLIGTLPLNNGFSLFGRFGYNRLQLKAKVTASGYGTSVTESDSESENKVVYGVGVAYAFAPNVAARLEVQKPHSDITKIAAGVTFGF
jgi:OOP family OmpA-OmpF porin